MVQTLQAREITLQDLETQFGLSLIEDDQFFANGKMIYPKSPT